MAERPPPAPNASTLRLEILKELQQLIDSREYRDRLDRSAIAETKGREHWVLHLLLRASEVETAHTDTLIGSAYSNLVSRLERIEDRLARSEEQGGQTDLQIRARLDSLDQLVGERIEATLATATDRLGAELERRLQESLDRKWAPIGESIETFGQGSKQMSQGVTDTFRLAAQTRLVLNDNSRRVSDLGRDLLALEESLKLVVARSLEAGFAAIDQRLGAIEAHLGLPNGGEAPPRAADPKAPSLDSSGLA